MSADAYFETGGKTFDTLDGAADFLLQELEAAPNRAAQKITREMRFALQRVAAEMREQHSSGWNGGVFNNTNRLQKRTGGGLQSILDSIRTKGGGNVDSIEGSISTGKMTIHETGGVIHARSSKYLTIPLPEAMDSRGVPLRKSARDWNDTFVQRSRKGNLIIFQRRGKDAVPLYLLKPQVTIKARLGMEKAFMGEVSFFQERLLDLIAKEFDK